MWVRAKGGVGSRFLGKSVTEASRGGWGLAKIERHVIFLTSLNKIHFSVGDETVEVQFGEDFDIVDTEPIS